MKHRFNAGIIGLTGLFLVAACGSENSGSEKTGNERAATPQPADESLTAEERFMTQLIEAKPGDIITLPEGTLSFDRGLSLTQDDVTIRGAGMDKTILDFKGQLAGAEGLLVKGSNFTIEDLAILDAKGDALKVNEGDSIIIRRVKTAWTGEPRTENGAYGIYPVQTTNVLIEGAVAYGASDAGIYVGQSKDVIIRDSRAEFNVAGIEIENTINADVYNNVATNNTGGILVFNMPSLSQRGYGTRVFNNQVIENNYRNFGHPGTPVASVVPGSGVVINSNDGVEIFDNDIVRNKTANIVVSSLFSTGYSEQTKSVTFDPYPESIYIYDNRFEGGGQSPGMPALAMMRDALFGPEGRLPDIIWDGFADPSKVTDGRLPDAMRICVDNGDAQVLNVDGPGGFAAPSMEQAPYKCTLKKLPEVVITSR